MCRAVQDNAIKYFLKSHNTHYCFISIHATGLIRLIKQDPEVQYVDPLHNVSY